MTAAIGTIQPLPSQKKRTQRALNTDFYVGFFYRICNRKTGYFQVIGQRRENLSDNTLLLRQNDDGDLPYRRQ